MTLYTNLIYRTYIVYESLAIMAFNITDWLTMLVFIYIHGTHLKIDHKVLIVELGEHDFNISQAP